MRLAVESPHAATRSREFAAAAAGGLHARGAGLADAALVAVVVMLAAGCLGSVESAAGPDPSMPPSDRDGLPVRSCDETQIDLTPIRLLTREEYNNSVRDLLGDTTEPLVDSPSADTGGFDNDAAALGISSPMARHYLDVSEGIAARAVAKLGDLLPCAPSGDGAACAEEFIRAFGRRAFRRPVPEEEVAALLALYGDAQASMGFSAAIGLVLQAMLNSPRFLYHIEVGTDAGDGVAALDDHEIAAKLSYYLWNTVPDAELDAAADAGELHTPEQIRAHAERMLASDRMRAVAVDLHTQWLDLKQVYAVTKDLAQYREFTDEVRDDLVKETLTFLDEVVWNDEGTVEDIFGATFTTVNARLAEFYGMKGISGDAYVRADVDKTMRRGLLTHGSLMTIHAKLDRTAPVHRGVFVRHEILCETLPPAPEVVPPLDVTDPTLPVRQRLESHTTEPGCRACHQYTDQMGFGFEHYDAVGRFRDVDEHGNDVNAKAVWVDITGKDEPREFNDAVELATAIAESPKTARCLSEQWYRYAMGRGNDEHDECTLDVLEQVAGADSVRDMVLAITTQDVFRYRAVVEPVGGCE